MPAEEPGWPRTCFADSVKHTCSVSRDLPLLAGDTIQASENGARLYRTEPSHIQFPDYGRVCPKRIEISTVHEGGTSIQVFLNRNDRYKPNLQVYAEIFSDGNPATSATCSITSDKTTAQLSRP